jgi:predicted polyphosphate/ATP-dependent NAD kinase
MASLGIIANPASGKDIRRLVSFATVIDNNEKANIVKRIILAAQALGVKRFFFMPDTFQFGYGVKESLEMQDILTAEIEILDLHMEGSAVDSTEAARCMEELGVDSIVVLGGDGTSRAVAKGVERTPIIPISTGTNNVFPRMLEGTVAGMAAAAVSALPDPYEVCTQEKRIEIWLNGEMADLALIDAVLTDDTYVGTKAVWDVSHVRTVVVTRCHPATIGLSAIAGSLRIVRDCDEGGFSVDISSDGRLVQAAIAAGVIQEVRVANERRLDEGEWIEIEADRVMMLALDGEREIRVSVGDDLRMRVCRSGPWRVDPERAIARHMLHNGIVSTVSDT